MCAHTIHDSREPIAVIGIGCRLPGNANSPRTFWQMLLSGQDAMNDLPGDRWNTQMYYHPDPTQPGKMYIRHGACLDQIDQFDPGFFGISALEASNMDPQQRLLLEVSYEALEDAGIPFHHLSGSATGVFIGTWASNYGDSQDVAAINAYTNAGKALSITSNRLSYFFNWHGPSLTVDTACSSSLVAVHLACQGLWQGDCTLALAGGVNVLLDPQMGIGLSKAQMVSPTGHCYAFDARADGYARGEGAGVVLLKPLGQAQADGDPIYGLIRATAVNHDGHTPGLHYPGQQAQEALLRKVYELAEVDPAQVYYIEAHGTGTSAGDYVESHAIGAVFADAHSSATPLRIGSVKSTIGHLEVASGLAGLIKTLLILRHRQIPAHLHFEQPNPRISFESLHLKIPVEVETISAEVEPLIAGVNSFGFGGTNAHVVLQDYPVQAYPPLEVPPSTSAWEMFAISAHTLEALCALAQAYLEYLHQDAPPPLRDLCSTAGHCRSHYAERLGLVVQSHADLQDQLARFLRTETIPTGNQAEGEKPIFVFSGNGSQWAGMGRGLYQHHPLFRSVVDLCECFWQPLAGWSFVEELLADDASSRMEYTAYAQPLLFVLQIAQVEIYRSWGIEPQAVIGHSVGEIAAAYVAGILSLEDALTVVYHRSRLQEQTAHQGAMAAVGISAEEAEALIAPVAPRVALGAINAPHSVTLSGEKQVLQRLIEPLAQQEIFCRFLKLVYAFHSAQMDPFQEELITALKHLQPRPSRLPFISTVTGQELAGTTCDAAYWWRNVRQPVQFAQAIQQVLEHGAGMFVEIGPHPVLAGYLKECLGERGGTVLASLRRGEEDLHQMMQVLAALYMQGSALTWEAVLPKGKRVSLPTYPWQRKRYWYETRQSSHHRQGAAVHPLLGYRLKVPQMSWENILDTSDLLYLFDHLIDGVPLFPAAGYGEIMLAVADQLFEGKAALVEQVIIHRPFFLRQDHPALFQTTVEQGQIHVQAYLSEQEDWAICATGRIAPLVSIWQPEAELAEIRARCTTAWSGLEFYDACRRHGFHYGPAFQLLSRLWTGEREAVGCLSLPEESSGSYAAYLAHPACLDSCLHLLFVLIWEKIDTGETPIHYLPVGWECLRFSGHPLTSSRLYSHVRLLKKTQRTLLANYSIYNEEGTLLLEVQGLRLQATTQADWQADERESLLYQECWQPVALSRTLPALPTPSLLAEEAQVRYARVAQDIPLDGYYQQVVPDLEALCRATMFDTFRQLNWEMQVGEMFTVQAICENLRILPRYLPLTQAWFLKLEEAGVLEAVDTCWRIRSLPEGSESAALLRAFLQSYPEHHGLGLLLNAFVPELAALFRGERDPQELLFPDGKLSIAESFFTLDVSLRNAHHLLRASLEQLLDHLPPDRPLRILEIGADNGQTTSFLLPFLPAYRTTYVLSDGSYHALKRAQERFHAYPFVEYRQLNLEEDPAIQGFQPHEFD
ncbi:MAG TPA: type I polyketide synthase, partial [Ktedonosporobacter sp.]|nr:type I polyketide synthase [Ktedonosporobacter sp.]